MRSPGRRIRRAIKHDGVMVDRGVLQRCYCAGTAKDESETEVGSYAIRSPANFDIEMDLCRSCAVALALKILELESL